MTTTISTRQSFATDLLRSFSSLVRQFFLMTSPTKTVLQRNSKRTDRGNKIVGACELGKAVSAFLQGYSH